MPSNEIKVTNVKFILKSLIKKENAAKYTCTGGIYRTSLGLTKKNNEREQNNVKLK